MKSVATSLGMTQLGQEARHCEKHGAYIAAHWNTRNGEYWTLCPGCAREESERLAREEVDRMEAERKQRRLEAIFDRAAIPARFKDRSFDTYKAQGEGQLNALRLCHEYAIKFDEVHKQGRCMVLAGEPGTGKTHLAIAVAKDIMKRGRSVLFVNVYEAIKRLRATWGGHGETEMDVMQTFRDVDLLILDEVGTQFGTAAEQNQIFEIINARYMDVKPTILISNLNVEEFKRILGDRTVDRLRENDGFMVKFDWQSYRGNT